MSDALSTFPGYGSPIPGKNEKGESEDKYKWFLEMYRDYRGRATLKSGAVVPIPMFFWDARGLLLHGTADADVVDGQLLPSGLRAQRSTEDKAQVQIWAPDYGSTTVGPIKAVFTSIRVSARRTCPPSHKDLEHWWFWWYYGNSVVNQQFKREVWGILNNELGVIEHLFDAPTKTVRLLEKGQVALRLKFGRREGQRWQTVSSQAPTPVADHTQLDKALIALSDTIAQGKTAPAKPSASPAAPVPGPAAFVTVSNRTNDDAENIVTLLGSRLYSTPDSIPFDKAHDEFYRNTATAPGRQLDMIGFEPKSWDFYSSYNGCVELYDAKGSGVKPAAPESSAETIAADLRKLMEDLRAGPR